MLQRMAGGTTPAHVADRYNGLIDALVIDETDAKDVGTVPFGDSPRMAVARTLMTDRDAGRRLAEAVLEVAA